MNYTSMYTKNQKRIKMRMETIIRQYNTTNRMKSSPNILSFSPPPTQTQSKENQNEDANNRKSI